MAIPITLKDLRRNIQWQKVLLVGEQCSELFPHIYHDYRIELIATRNTAYAADLIVKTKNATSNAYQERGSRLGKPAFRKGPYLDNAVEGGIVEIALFSPTRHQNCFEIAETSGGTIGFEMTVSPNTAMESQSAPLAIFVACH